MRLLSISMNEWQALALALGYRPNIGGAAIEAFGSLCSLFNEWSGWLTGLFISRKGGNSRRRREHTERSLNNIM